jgi:signal transduction histidine kinase
MRYPASEKAEIIQLVDFEKLSLNINDVIREVMTLVQRELTSHQVSLRTEFAPALPMILGDRLQLQQVIINLVMNGAEAMQSVTDRPRELVIRSGQDETQQVLVSVTDCGVGIPDENADRLFNPFFTTKSSGMGMGLSICRSDHGSPRWPAVGDGKRSLRCDVSVHPAVSVLRLYVIGLPDTWNCSERLESSLLRSHAEFFWKNDRLVVVRRLSL